MVNSNQTNVTNTKAEAPAGNLHGAQAILGRGREGQEGGGVGWGGMQLIGHIQASVPNLGCAASFALYLLYSKHRSEELIGQPPLEHGRKYSVAPKRFLSSPNLC